MKKVEIFKEGKDIGDIGLNQTWWFDLNFIDSFEIFDIDSFYSDTYFKRDHVSNDIVNNYVKYVKEYFKKITNNELTNVLEIGCGGGWFTKGFLNNGIDVFAVEGSICGYQATLNKGVDSSKILHHDLRRELKLNKKFDICCCTEVAEHIETPFSSQLINTLTIHSDLIWFSFEVPGTNRAHYHHCNEQPPKFWINIFNYYDYNYLKIPNEIAKAVAGRGTYLFYNKNKFNI